MKNTVIGHLLRASNSAYVFGCQIEQIHSPSFGALVGIACHDGYQVYGLIHDIRITDDGLVRQLITAGTINEEIILDNRINRNVPVEIGVLAIGYRQNDRIFHLLPPRPPLTLDAIYLCAAEEIVSFCSAGRFGYFRHILRAVETPIGELLAAHFQQVYQAYLSIGDTSWVDRATREVIIQLRDDYPTLMSVLGALADSGITFSTK